MKKWVLIFLSIVMMLGLVVPAPAEAGTTDHTQEAARAAYTVEFTYEGRQYVMQGDSSVALSEILSTLGLTGKVTAVEVSDPGLFSVSGTTGEWVVTAHQAFDSNEWMKVTINGVVYEIAVTDDNAINMTGPIHIKSSNKADYNGRTITGTFSKKKNNECFDDGPLITPDYWPGAIIIDGIDVSLTIDNLTIDIQGDESTTNSDRSISGICLVNDATLHLTLQGNSTIRAAGDGAGICVREGCRLFIESGSTGSLTAYGGCNLKNDADDAASFGGAGIGAAADQYHLGEIHIAGGTVNAYGGSTGLPTHCGAAAIGGSFESEWTGSIDISGGTVNAYAKYENAAIGGAWANTVQSITISGGTVTAEASQGAAIGCGRAGSTIEALSCGDIRISSGAVVTTTGNIGYGVEGSASTMGYAGGSVNIDENVNLTYNGQISAPSIEGKYVVAFDPNGGSGYQHPIYVNQGRSVNLKKPSFKAPRIDETFLYWELVEGSSITNTYTKKQYEIGEYIPIRDLAFNNSINRYWVYSNVKLKAHWINHPHDHDISYVADGASLIGTCEGDDRCDLWHRQVRLTLQPPAHLTYDGESKAASVDSGNVSGIDIPDISYAKSGDNTFSGVPVDAGTYTASIKDTGATASVEYTIVQASLTDVDVTQSGTLTYTGEAQTPQVNATATAKGGQTVTFTYSKTQDGTYGPMPTVTNVADSGTFYYKASAPNHGDAAGRFTVTVNKADQDAPAAPTKAGSTISSITLTAVDGCEYSKDNEHWQDNTTFSGLDSYTEYTFYQRKKEDANHNASQASTAKLRTDHVHSWSYDVQGDTITATCENSDNNHEGSVTDTLRILAPAGPLVYDGTTAFPASFESDKTSVGGINPLPSIQYQKKNGENWENAVATAPVDTGTYRASITVDPDKTAYTGEYTIEPGNMAVSSAGWTGEYDGDSHGIQVTAPAGAGIAYRTTDSGDYSLTSTPAYTDVGTYTVYYRVTKDHYNPVEGSETVTISSARLTNVSVSQKGTLSYTGKAQTPEVIAAAGAQGNQPVTFTYSRTQDGTYGAMPSVTGVADGGTFYYKATAPNHADASGSFIVTVQKGTAPTVNVPTPDAVTYDPAKTLENVALPANWAWVTDTTVPTVGNSGYAAALTVDDVNYDYANIDGYDSATRKVIRNVTVTVNKAEVTAPVISGKTYTGETLTADVEQSALYSVKTNNGGMNAGNYDVVLTLADSGNYRWTDSEEAEKTLTFLITPASITEATVTLSDASFVYTGSEQSVTVNSVRLGDAALAERTDYEVTGDTAGTVRNTYTVTVTGKGNYADSATAQWSIGIATPTIETNPAASAITYGHTLADSALSGGAAKLGDHTVAGAFAWKNTGTKPAVSDSEKTEYAVVFTPADTDNCTTVECRVKLTVNKADPTLTAPTAKTLTYTGTAQELVGAGSATGGTMYYAVTTENTAPTDENLYTRSIPAKTDAGTCYVWYKVVGDANHLDSKAAKPVQVGIAQKSIAAASVTLSATALTYTGSQQTVAVSSVMLGSTTLTANDYDVSGGTAGTDKGTYTVIVTGKGNYKDSASAAWSIGLATPSIAALPAASAITEGQKLSDSTLTGGSATLGGKPVAGTFAWKNPAIKPAVSDSRKTEYDVVFTPADQKNYAAAACKVTLTVNPGNAQVPDPAPAQQPQTEAPAAPPTEQPQTEQPQTEPAPAEQPQTEAPAASPTEQPQTEAPATPPAEQPQAEAPAAAPAADPALELLSGFLVVCRDSKLQVRYGLVSGADSYDIYAGYCGGKKLEKVMTVTGSSAVISKLNGKKPDMTRSFGVYVAAMAGGKEIARTFTAHVAGRKHETYTNVKKVRPEKTKLKLQAGKSKKLGVNVILENSRKKEISHRTHKTHRFHFYSTDQTVATVSRNGRVYAVGAGECRILISAMNGRSAWVKVTVR